MMKTHNNIKLYPRIAISIFSIIMLLVFMSFNISDSSDDTKITINSLSEISNSPPNIPPLDLSKVKVTSGYGMRATSHFS